MITGDQVVLAAGPASSPGIKAGPGRHVRTSPDGKRRVQGEFGAISPALKLFTTGLGTVLPPNELTTLVSAQLARPGADGLGTDTPYLYGLIDLVAGKFPTGFVRTVQDRDLAEVDIDYAKGGGDNFYVHNSPMRGGFGPSYPVLSLTAPAALEKHLEAGPTTWFQPVWKTLTVLPVTPDGRYDGHADHGQRLPAAVTV